MAGQNPIFIPAGEWVNVLATVTAGVGVETVIQNDPDNSGQMDICWDGAELIDGQKKGIVLFPGEADFRAASACWVQFRGRKGGLVRIDVRG